MTMKDQQAANKRRKQEAEALWMERKSEIEWLYNDQEWSQAKIAEHYGISQSAFHKVMKRLGIKARGRGNKGKRNGRYKDGSQSTLYRLMITKDKCANCGAINRLVIHHKNGNHQDNHLENLQVLCESCHNSLTKRLWWKKQKGSLL
jgi:hypothetical protein